MKVKTFVSKFHVGGSAVRFASGALVIMLMTCLPAAAQSDWRIFGGFSYLDLQTSPEMEPFGLDHIKSMGWGASVTQYTSWAPWFGATAEASGGYKLPTIKIPADYFGEGYPEADTKLENVLRTTTYTVMLGPSFAYRKNSQFEPFAHFLMGGIYEEGTLTSKGAGLVGLPISGSEWTFGYAIGGGADIKISKLLALRGQADWIRSTFADGEEDRQNNMRIMGGLVFRLSE